MNTGTKSGGIGKLFEDEVELFEAKITEYEGKKSFHTPSIPFGGRIDTNGVSLCSIVFDFSGDLSDNRLISCVYNGFTRQGSEVQILSRLPCNWLILLGLGSCTYTTFFLSSDFSRDFPVTFFGGPSAQPSSATSSSVQPWSKVIESTAFNSTWSETLI